MGDDSGYARLKAAFRTYLRTSFPHPHANKLSSYLAKSVIEFRSDNMRCPFQLISNERLIPRTLRQKVDSTKVATDGGHAAGKAGLGVYFCNRPGDLHRPVAIASACPGKQTNNRAEAFAILLAMLMARPDQDIEIVTDSQCSIDSLRRVCAVTRSPKLETDVANYCVFETVRQVRSERTGEVSLTKVKSHTEKRGHNYVINGFADCLATLGVRDAGPPVMREPVHNLRPCTLILGGEIVENRTHSQVFMAVDRELLSRALNHPDKADAHIQRMRIKDDEWEEATCVPGKRNSRLALFEPRLLAGKLCTTHNINTFLKDFPRVYPEGRCFFCDEPGTEYHILCGCPRLQEGRGRALNEFRKGLRDLSGGKVWPAKSLAKKWVFPSDEVDFRHGKVPASIREWMALMSAKGLREEHYVRKVRGLLTVAYHALWGEYTDKLSKASGHLNGRIKTLYNTTSKNMHILRDMTEEQRLNFRPHRNRTGTRDRNRVVAQDGHRTGTHDRTGIG